MKNQREMSPGSQLWTVLLPSAFFHLVLLWETEAFKMEPQLVLPLNRVSLPAPTSMVPPCLWSWGYFPAPIKGICTPAQDPPSSRHDNTHGHCRHLLPSDSLLPIHFSLRSFSSADRGTLIWSVLKTASLASQLLHSFLFPVLLYNRAAGQSSLYLTSQPPCPHSVRNSLQLSFPFHHLITIALFKGTSEWPQTTYHSPSSSPHISPFSVADTLDHHPWSIHLSSSFYLLPLCAPLAPWLYKLLYTKDYPYFYLPVNSSYIFSRPWTFQTQQSWNQSWLLPTTLCSPCCFYLNRKNCSGHKS